MEKRYTGNKEELNKAKSQGISSKTKKFIATALIGGSLFVAGSPTIANTYTAEQLATHQRHVDESNKSLNNISDGLRTRLDSEFEQNKNLYTEEQRAEVRKKLDELIGEQKKEIDEGLGQKYTNILDKNLVFMKNLPKKEGDTKQRVQLNLNDISSLNKEQIESLEKNYHIDFISMNRYYNIDADSNTHDRNLSRYSVDDYKKILDLVDSKFGDLKNNKNLTDLEKATIVLKRMQNIDYDMNALMSNTNYEKGPDLQDSSKDSVWTSRNMIDPLMKNTGICAGYSDLFKNVMSYLDIEAKEIRGNLKNALVPPNLIGIQDGANHAWNQVKIDGNWYNIDITALNTDKRDSLQPNNSHPFLFVSDKEFNEYRSSKMPSNYKPIFGLPEEATSSIPEEEVDKALITAKNYEKNLAKSKNSLLAKANKGLNNLRNRFTKQDKKEDMDNESLKPEQVSSKNTREEFLAYLSNNGEYQGKLPTTASTNTLTRDNSLENDDIERG